MQFNKFFIVVDKEIWTSTGEHCLNGVTRGAIIDLCRRNNILVMKKILELKMYIMQMKHL